ncbi:hypothetical protein K474DRAFT_1775640 [Panus rudis PR-1116 ss-1]|nr:hypothetical protein K474DRAFT_1775640 [Panus rudis PR-1116 ss-1]
MEEIHLLWTFELEKVTATVWHELDQSLNTPTFANLRLLRITTWDEFPLDTDGFDEFAANHLPQCHSRGIVKYGCTAKLEERLRRWGFVWIDDTEVNYLS